MEDILDDDYSEREKGLEDKRTKHKTRKSILYFVIMIIGGAVYGHYEYNFELGLYHLLVVAFSVIMMAAILSIISESIRYFVRKRKEKKQGVKVLYDPFWYQLIESGFAFWILTMFIIIVGNKL